MSSNFTSRETTSDGNSYRERRREIECVSERARRTCCATYAALQTSQIILSCICIMCIGMATHLDRKSTCTVIETNMVILLGAYLAYFSLTNQSREVTCDFGFASGVGAGYDGWYPDDREFLKSLQFLSHVIITNKILSFHACVTIRVSRSSYLGYDDDDYLHHGDVRACLATYFYFYARNFCVKKKI